MSKIEPSLNLHVHSINFRHRRNVISTWSSGTGGAGIIGAASYAGLRVFMSSADALLLMLIVPVIQALTFWLMLKHPEPSVTLVVENGGVGSQEQIIEAPKMTVGEKMRLVPGLMKYMIPLGLVYLFEYFINQGLVSFLLFSKIFAVTAVCCLCMRRMNYLSYNNC